MQHVSPSLTYRVIKARSTTHPIIGTPKLLPDIFACPKVRTTEGKNRHPTVEHILPYPQKTQTYIFPYVDGVLATPRATPQFYLDKKAPTTYWLVSWNETAKPVEPQVHLQNRDEVSLTQSSKLYCSGRCFFLSFPQLLSLSSWAREHREIIA